MKAALVACVLLAAVGLAAAQPCLSTDGLAMIKGFEGFRSRQYKDSAGIWTIGYGTLCSTGTLKCPGPVTEAAAAAEMGRSITANYGPCVRQYVKVALNNNQYSALVSFAYNAGCGSLQNLAKVTNGVLANFPAHMVLYNKATVNGRLTVVQGLVNRRNAEVAMFRSTKATTCATRNGQVLAAAHPRPSLALPLCRDHRMCLRRLPQRRMRSTLRAHRSRFTRRLRSPNPRVWPRPLTVVCSRRVRIRAK